MAARLVWNGDDVSRDVRRGAEEGLGDALEHLLTTSQAVAPIEEATLIRSGTVTRDGLHGAVSYDTVYAARQHEELTWGHDPGRTAKYLERPFNSERATMLRVIGAAVRRRVGT